MRVYLLLSFILCYLTGCGVLGIHKVPVQQGNVLTTSMLSKLHNGLTLAEVKDRLGSPVLVNSFDSTRLVYVYTYMDSDTPMTQKRLALTFKKGRLADYEPIDLSHTDKR